MKPTKFVHSTRATRSNCPALRGYISHRNNCQGNRKRDRLGNIVEMRLTYSEWLWIWLQSGQLDQRGVGKGKYVMSRKDDLGHYERGNVFIQSFEDNTRDAWAGVSKTQEQRDKASASMTGFKNRLEPCSVCGKDIALNKHTAHKRGAYCLKTADSART